MGQREREASLRWDESLSEAAEQSEGIGGMGKYMLELTTSSFFFFLSEHRDFIKLYFIFEIGSCYVAQAGLTFAAIFLP